MPSAASVHLTGFPAALLILVILALIIVGFFTVIRSAKRKASGR